MIIGIAGKLGSGKDTVGSIIQYLTSEYRDKYDYTNWADRVNNYGSDPHSSFINKKFAGKLKTIASLLTGIPVENFEDQEFKKTDLPNEWCYIENGYAARNMTVRDLLQRLGTEAMRDGLHKNVWVNALFADYTKRIIYYPLTEEQIEYNNKQTVPVPSVNEKLDYPNWILTDMRFPNEMGAVKERDGITIRVNRTTFRTTETEFGKVEIVNQPIVDERLFMHKEHPSETALDDAEFDYEIQNDGTFEDLVEKVREILTKSGIL